MQFRHEVKHELAASDLPLLRRRLRAVMQPDSHAPDGKYEIRSLYFDTPDDTALREKLDGVGIREKYRLRMYNFDPSVIHLERKFKQGGLGCKQVAALSISQVRALLAGDAAWMKESGEEVVRGFYARFCHAGLRPKVLVDYTREPFVFAAGNVRVTLDYAIRTALSCTDFLNPDCVSIPVADEPCILEVKWDNFLPDVVRDAVQLGERHATAYSKYAASRMYD